MMIDQKELEIQEWEEKYKKYVEKAKTLCKSMDTSLSDVDTSVLQNRLLKANQEINDLKVGTILLIIIVNYYDLFFIQKTRNKKIILHIYLSFLLVELI